MDDEEEPPEFPISVERLGAIVAAILRSTGSADLAQIVMASALRADFDGYSGYGAGRDFWIILEVPVAEFVPVRDRRDAVEAALLAAFKEATRQYPNDHIEQVVLAPTLIGESSSIPTATSTVGEHLWPPGTFHLFVSHVHTLGPQVAALGSRLGIFGISCFIAHRDIGVTREWRGEILAGLQSMDAMVVVLTEDYHSRLWTDHEYGFALGSGKPTLTLMVDAAHPYGFMEREQGMRCDLSNLTRVADEVITVFLGRSDTGPAIRHAFVTGLETSQNWADSNALIVKIVANGSYDQTDLERMEAAIKNNDEVANCSRLRTLRQFLDGP